MPKLTKDSLVVKLDRIVDRLDRCSKKDYPKSARTDFDRIADQLVVIREQVENQETPIY
jgi:hypothetical protein